jgi:hypothetical protein
MKHAILAAFLLFPFAVEASEVKELSLPPSDATGLFNALQTLGTKERICKDGANEKPCSEQIDWSKAPGLNLVIALDIGALKRVLDDYQYAQRKVVGAMTGGSGYLEKGSRQDAEANFKLADLAREPLKVTLSTISRKELLAAKADISPSVHALLLPILEE